MNKSIKCFAVSTLFWWCIAAIGYSYCVTYQLLVVPNQTGYMEVRHNDLKATPIDFDVTNTALQPSSSDALDNLVREVSR